MPKSAQNATIYSSLTKTVRYFAIVGDISPFDRYFHCILYAVCYERHFYLWNMPKSAQNATIYSILTKTVRYFAIVVDFSPFKCHFHFISRAECYACQFHRRKEQMCAQNSTISSILKKTVRYFAIFGDISPFDRYFHCILYAECYARYF